MPPAGPEDEAARLYDALGTSLYRYAVMLLADREAAEDVIQQVFAAVIGRGLGRVEDPERYLRRSVRNACYSMLQQRSGPRILSGASADQLLETVPGAMEPSGAPLLYKREPGAYTIYSVGLDRQDDGGDIASELHDAIAAGRARRDIRGRDIGVRVLVR
jgi:DNA-directed RNA polymerase specialized sigma24 family protein